MIFRTLCKSNKNYLWLEFCPLTFSLGQQMRSWLSLERKACPSEKGGREVWARSYISTWASRILQGGGRQGEVWLAIPVGGSKERSLGVTPRCDAALQGSLQVPAPLQGYVPPCTVLRSFWAFLSPLKIKLGETAGPSGSSSPCTWGLHFPQRVHENSPGQVWLWERHS